MRLLLIIFFVCLVFGYCPRSQAAALYNNTSLSGPTTTVNPTGLFDDVLIPAALELMVQALIFQLHTSATPPSPRRVHISLFLLLVPRFRAICLST